MCWSLDLYFFSYSLFAVELNYLSCFQVNQGDPMESLDQLDLKDYLEMMDPVVNLETHQRLLK